VNKADDRTLVLRFPHSEAPGYILDSVIEGVEIWMCGACGQFKQRVPNAYKLPEFPHRADCEFRK
jgi:hypothetical protein